MTALQLKAIELLAGGRRVGDVAKTLDVDRRTIWSRSRYEPEFVAELNRLRADLVEASRDAMRSMASAARDAIRSAVEAGDVDVSLEALKSIGAMEPAQLGPTEPEDVELANECAAGKRVERSLISD